MTNPCNIKGCELDHDSVKVKCGDCDGAGEIGERTSLSIGTDGMGNVEYTFCINCDGYGWLWEDEDGTQRLA